MVFTLNDQQRKIVKQLQERILVLGNEIYDEYTKQELVDLADDVHNINYPRGNFKFNERSDASVSLQTAFEWLNMTADMMHDINVKLQKALDD